MKKKTIIILIAALAVSVIGNVFFLTQNVFEATYYGKLNGSPARISIKGYVAKFSTEDMPKDLGGSCVFSYGNFNDKDSICFFSISDPVRRMGTFIDETPFVLRSNEVSDPWNGVNKNSIYVCYSAIIFQILWLLIDVVLFTFLIKNTKQIKLPKYKLKIVKKETN